jgi:hypothetical protein
MTIRSTMHCVLCDCPFDEALDSNEHIIPNALGGWLKVPGVLCSTCNSRAGHEWDAELARQLNPLALFFGIARENGGTPSQVFETLGGEKIRLHADDVMTLANPTLERTPQDDGSLRINITARTLAEAEGMLEGLQRKYPALDVSQGIATAQRHLAYPAAIRMSLRIGGSLAGRSLVKSTVCLAAAQGVDARACDESRAFLCDNTNDGRACFQFFYDHDVLVNRPPNVPLHCVAVSNRGAGGQMLGYVELYGTFRILVRLAKDYCGNDIHSVYAVDPTTGREFQTEVNLNIASDVVSSVLAREEFPGESVRIALGNVVEPRLAEKHEREFARVKEEAFALAFRDCGAKEGEELQPEHVQRIIDLAMNKLEPYIRHRLSPIKVDPTTG